MNMPLLEFDVAAWDTTMAVNMRAVMLCTKVSRSPAVGGRVGDSGVAALIAVGL